MATTRRKRFKTAPVGRRTPGELMLQPSSGEKHPTPKSVAGLMKQPGGGSKGSAAHMTVKSLMKQ